ncbi:DEAD/DEAH box helicase [Nonomuraea sp. NBC_01738]|uniref:DEAD/DEAH box helicase n=1 Tax=Nonomuraea sp. NBC_01738 TaxID=2976003 RepID=UPI002E0EC3CD
MVVHGVWADGALAFWAEAPAAPSAAPAPEEPGATDPPAAGPGALNALGVVGEERVLTLLLPGTSAGPVPSPETGVLPSATRPRLLPWRISAVVPSRAGLLTALEAATTTGFTTATNPGAASVPGATLRFWAAVAEFAADLVRRGRVIPTLQASSADPLQAVSGPRQDMWAVPVDDAVARWEPVLTGADAAHFRDLVTAMPPACRTGAEEHGGSAVLREALAAFADAHVRRRVREPLAARPRTVRDRWLAALTGDDDACPDVPELRGELDRWRTAVHAAESAARVCFRLVEPPDDDYTPQTEPPDHDPAAQAEQGSDHGWRVELALQAVDDPSLYLPAERVWAGPGVPGLSERELLAGLGRAVRLYPGLDPALRVARPYELRLDTAGAFTFLRDAAPLLQAAGFGVQLPRWAGRARLGLKLTTRAKRQSAAVAQGFGLAQLVDFRVELAVGDQAVSEDELAELARLKVPLVRVRGQWVELDERQLKAALRAVEGRRDGELPAGELLRHVIQGGGEELPLVGVDADGVLGDLLSGQAEHRLTPLTTPPGLDATLRPYQERGLAWLSFLSELGLGGVLADDMGLGKTITTLALLVHERAAATDLPPTLLVCPMSLVGNWQREAARFAPGLRVRVHHGAGRDASLIAGADLVITTYGTAQRDLETLGKTAWHRVVCDEAQAIKNSGTLQARAVRSIPARGRLALTGTPVENHLAELWSIMEFCNPGLLGSRGAFRERFQEPIEARGDEHATTLLKRATGPFVLRRLKTDRSVITDLPDKLEVKEWCPLTAEQASLYRAVVDDMMGRIDDSEGIERRGLVLAAMAKLKQVCNHPAHLLKDGSRLAGRSGKLARLEELAGEIVAEGEKALVFTQYAEFGAMLQPYLAQRLDRPVLWLHGGLTKKARDRLVERFQHDGEPMLFLLSLKAAGVGLNLTAANHVIHVDRWWNPAVEDQATDRAFRIGQRKNVQVRKLICAGTLEERVDAMIERKKALAERVVGSGEDWLTDLSSAELREVFTLGTVG